LVDDDPIGFFQSILSISWCLEIIYKDFPCASLHLGVLLDHGINSSTPALKLYVTLQETLHFIRSLLYGLLHYTKFTKAASDTPKNPIKSVQKPFRVKSLQSSFPMQILVLFYLVFLTMDF
jgi:hypothetical protein